MLSAAFSQGNNQQRQMLAIAGVLLCAPAGGAWISLANSHKPEPTAVVNMICTHAPAGSVVGKRSRRPCAFSEDWGGHNVVFPIPNT